MISFRMSVCVVILIAVAMCCSTVSAGPIDNANEFVDKAVSEAEEGSNPPADQSPDTPPISWEGQGSGTNAAVNTDTTSSTDTQ